MATKPCPDCGNQVSEVAQNCPNCRRFTTHRSGEMVVRAWLFFIIVSIMIINAS